MYPPQQGYPPPGYGPPGYPPPGYRYPYVPMQPQRSGVPRTLGILAIIFSIVGLLASMVWWWGPLSDVDKYGLRGQLHGTVTWLNVWMGISSIVFVLHLIGGILAAGYKRAGLRLLTVYAIVAILFAIIDVVVLQATMHDYDRYDMRFSIFGMHIFFSVCALPWPITALALANGARAKEACGVTASQVADAF